MRIGREQREQIAYVWTEKPLEFPKETWLQLFKMVAPITDRGLPYTRPETPLTVYRGAPAQFMRGMSWTPCIDVAIEACAIHKFRWQTGDDPRLWKTRIEPSQILAYFNGRLEQEFVVDPAPLENVEFSLDELDAYEQTMLKLRFAMKKGMGARIGNVEATR